MTEVGCLVVGIGGAIRSGKDAAAAYLIQRHGFRLLKWADPLRACIEALDPVIGISPTGGVIRVSDAKGTYSYEGMKDQFPEYRRMLQRMGTDVGRRLIADDLWVKATEAKFADGDRIVISDTRFPNEVDAVRRHGGQYWRVERPGAEVPADAHVSERALRDVPPDLTIVNDSTLDALHLSVEAALRGLLQGERCAA